MILKILVESLRKLRSQPLLFMPKLFSTTLSSLFLIGLIFQRAALTKIDPTLLAVSMASGLFIITLIGIFSSVMLSAMVKNSTGLRQGFKDTAERIIQLIGLSLGVIGFGLVLSAVVGVGAVLTTVTGSIFPLVWSIASALALMIVSSYVIYFLPITVLEQSGLRKAVDNSMRASSRNRTVVIGLLLFSLALITLAAVSTGALEGLGYLGFLSGRLLSSIVNTYLFTVSPTFYVEEREE